MQLDMLDRLDYQTKKQKEMTERHLEENNETSEKRGARSNYPQNQTRSEESRIPKEVPP